MKNKQSSPKATRHNKMRILRNVLIGVVFVILAVLLSFRVSPWPGALVIRHVFDQGAEKTLIGLQNVVPPQSVSVISDQVYDGNSKNKLDVYIPNDALRRNDKLPVVIWTHGGAWLSGDKTNAGPYFELLSSQGFVVVSLNYTLAPGAVYPEQIKQLNQAHHYLLANADRFHLDTSNIFLAGDSAGAQFSSQLGALVTNQSYAEEVNIKPALTASQLRGVLLFCGIYKMEGLANPDPTLPKLVSWGDDISVWSYTGTRDRKSPLIRQMSAYYHVTKEYPATFITGGNADPLTEAQSIPFSQELQRLGVATTTLFYPKDHIPALPHEYQFNLDHDGGQAFSQAVDFLKREATQ